MREKMRCKKGLGLLAASVAAVFLWVTFSAAVVECPDTIVIKNDGWAKVKYEPVQFHHKKHSTEYKVPCAECHHVYKDGKNVWKEGEAVQKCSSCHNVYKLGKELREASDQEKKMSLYKAYHTNCKGCHKANKKGPTKCTGCHAKKPKE